MSGTVHAQWTDGDGTCWNVRGRYSRGWPGDRETPGERPHVEDMEILCRGTWRNVEDYATKAEAVEIEEALLGIE